MYRFSTGRCSRRKDQRWIAAYEFFELERDEEKVLLLGRDGNAISVQQIMDALDLVDTEDYRALVERLQAKGLIQGKRLPRAGRHGKSRSSPRWRVVQPKEANANLGDLVQATITVFDGGNLSRSHFNRIFSRLRKESPYLRDRIGQSLRILALIGPNQMPTGRLQALIDNEARSVKTSKTAKASGSGPRLSDARAKRSAREEKAEAAIAEDGAAEAELIAGVRRRKLYVGNLPWRVTAAELEAHIAAVGEVVSVSVPRDVTRPGRSRGFGFVEMASDAAAHHAKATLHDTEFMGRRLLLDWARS